MHLRSGEALGAAKGKKDTILSRQMLFKMKRAVVLFVRTPVRSYLQVLKWQKLLTLGVDTTCEYTLTHSSLDYTQSAS